MASRPTSATWAPTRQTCSGTCCEVLADRPVAAVLALDVLEHLPTRSGVLLALRDRLVVRAGRPGAASVVVSIPNVTHVDVAAKLLLGPMGPGRHRPARRHARAVLRRGRAGPAVGCRRMVGGRPRGRRPADQRPVRSRPTLARCCPGRPAPGAPPRRRAAGPTPTRRPTSSSACSASIEPAAAAATSRSTRTAAPPWRSSSPARGPTAEAARCSPTWRRSDRRSP